ncbi:MAG TPA: LytR C-terminal domain-containing protein [Acidimicrobiales bacterium]|nr:LytR C-terminal domain-containing protein [Acidimicrobiales bacterium]
MGRAWRERILTALLVIVVAVPVGVVIGGGLGLGRPDEEPLEVGVDAETTTTAPTDRTTTSASLATTTTTTTAATTTSAAPSRAPGQVKVRFYNGSRTAGAAVTVGDRLAAAGYTVLAPGPSPANPIEATTIAHREGWAAEAAAVATALGLDPSAARPMPPVPAVAGVGDADVVVIVAEDALRP